MKGLKYMLKDFGEFHTGSDDQFTIEQRLFNVVSFYVGIVSIAASMINVILGSERNLIFFTASFGLISWIAFYLARIRRQYLPGKIFMSYGAILLFTWVYFINNGLWGPVLYLYLVFYTFLIFIWTGRGRTTIIAVFFLNITFLFLAEIYFPDWIKEYDDRITRILDVYLTFYLFALLVGVIMMFAKSNYIKEKRRAEQSDKLKSAFLANMSHEIRTPMNAIMGFTQLLHNEESLDKRREYLRVIDENGLSLLRLIDDIIDISKIEAGEIKIIAERCDLNQLVDDLVQAHRSALPEENAEDIDIIDRSPKEQVIIFSDLTRIRQILDNLISNAKKYTEKGAITIGFDLMEDEILFYVEDTGIGIRQEHQKEIFDRFRKIETDDGKRAIPGTGIGLSISRNLVEQLGGSLTVDSCYGEGSKFQFTIPNTPYPEGDSGSGTPDKRVAEMKQLGDFKVLIAEDDPTNFLFLKKVVERLGGKVYHAVNGVEAIQLAESHRVDIVLMDIMMPIMNGYEATKKIKKRFPDLPIIGQTALAMEGDKERVLQSGCDAYLPKPVQVHALKAMVAKYINATSIKK